MQYDIASDRCIVDEDFITANYTYETSRVSKDATNGRLTVSPLRREYVFRTAKRVPKVGLMMVGWGGNNGTTVTAGILANKHNLTWRTKEGLQRPDYIGSLTQASTLHLGTTSDGEMVHIPFKNILPMVDPNDIEVGGWDINGLNMAASMERAQVLDFDLQRQLVPLMEHLNPLPSIYYPDFIASNQADRANNVVGGTDKWAHVERIREDIRSFKEERGVDKVIILWTANTERFADVREGLNDTEENLIAAIKQSADEVSPSTVFAVASLLEGCSYINGSPQNTFVPGLVEMAERLRIYIGGDDFKTGQTKMKSVLVDFLVSAGIKPESIVSYNHLGNNDGKNLSSQRQFRSKEISKSNVVDDMVNSNDILYPVNPETGVRKHPDHVVVIKYVPNVQDSKRAMDEYANRIFLGGQNTIALHNTCEDSLLAAPLILDLVILCELMERITFTTEEMTEFEPFHPVNSILSYLLKAPMVPDGTPVVNSLFKQRAALENVFRACVGLAPQNNMLLEHKAVSTANIAASRVHAAGRRVTEKRLDASLAKVQASERDADVDVQ